MPSPLPRILLVLALCLAFSHHVVAQVEHVVGAPFTATKTLYTERSSHPSVTQIARSSDGSVYYGSYGSDGQLSQVVIEDAPNNRQISYFAPRPNNHDHTYTQRTPSNDYSKETVDQVRERLRRNQRYWAENPDLEKDNHRYHFVALGERPGDGMTLYGVRTEITDQDGDKHISEYWESDLGIMMSSARSSPEEERESHWVITNLRPEEPDPSLFQIPKQYLDDPLLDANTIFIDNQTGSADVLNGAVREFNSWKKTPNGVKPLAIVADRKAADLTATLTMAVADQESTVSGVMLQVYLRNSQEPVFEITERSPGTSHDDEFAALRCVEELRNRLANTRVGLRQPGSQPNQTPTSK